MSDISVSERRLSAALDRMDRLLEAGAARPAVAAPDEAAIAAMQQRLEDLQVQNTRLAAENAALRAEGGGPADAALDEAQARLTAFAEQAARLVVANDDLAAANRALIDAAADAGDGEQAVRDALSAEIEALHAARAAEITQMGEIMVELERLLVARRAAAPVHDGPDHASDVAQMPEVAADSAGVPEDEDRTDDDHHATDGAAAGVETAEVAYREDGGR